MPCFGCFHMICRNYRHTRTCFIINEYVFPTDEVGICSTDCLCSSPVDLFVTLENEQRVWGKKGECTKILLSEHRTCACDMVQNLPETSSAS